ncbi:MULTISPECIES: RidA family protein [Pigmentiphaga]|uniref:RidA family protein n=1 Tax=Pigmentiphaga daeguensis TaxID=414049 RepID=A0ABP3LLQ6_9BURK|nr:MULTISPECIES: RidA family protein [unclassified Pigmentiphaga]OVZ63636.1 hypothetical protein CDO46_12045 [Pigmentiphaga sp. NML030171]
MSIHRVGPGKRMSEISVFNGVLYLAGQVPRETRGRDIREQTAEVLAMIDGLLEGSGSNRSRLLSCQIFLRDMALFASMNEVWDAWVAAGQAPARATVQAALASPGCDIEIVAVAAA